VTFLELTENHQEKIIMKRSLLFSTALIPLLAAALVIQISEPLNKPETATPTRGREFYGQLPLSFEANEGQAGAPIKFLSRGKGYTLALASTEAVLSFSQPVATPNERKTRSAQNIAGHQESRNATNTVLRMKLVGANPQAQVAGLEALPGRVNYFIGNDPAKWRRNVPTYAKVKYQEVYPGVDLVYYGSSIEARQLEYDFVVAPGVDPQIITLGFDGADKLEVEAQGDLVLHTSESEAQIRFHKPFVYQEVEGVRQEIAGGYAFNDNHQVGFQLEAYDTTKPLVIDPVLSYSTYLGGSSDDLGVGIAVDAGGNMYVTGYTTSADFPTRNPLQPNYRRGVCGVEPDTFATEDVFVAKLNSTGTALVYSTYLGGTGNDIGRGIAVDASGNVYLSGVTNSTNFPTASPLQPTFGGGSGECFSGDVFMAKLNAAGSALVYSTYLGGSSDRATHNVVVDAAGNARSGLDAIDRLPASNPLQNTLNSDGKDAFVAKLNPAGSALVYSTYLGGNGADEGRWITVDASGNAYVTGFTASDSFATVGAVKDTFDGSQDAFVTKLNAAGSARLYSTYLGGSGEETGNSIGVDASGNAYVTGSHRFG
jgi:hypothetical protein